MNDYVNIRQPCNAQQQLAHINLCTESEALEWWKANRHRYAAWEEVKNTIREYYCGHYKLDRAVNDTSEL